MNVTRLIAMLAVTTTIAAAQELAWAELARRSELWPAQCTVKETMKFDGGVTVAAGQKVKVVQVKPEEAQLATLDDRTYFAAEPDETDLLAVARAGNTLG